jgi:hypothetical protein
MAIDEATIPPSEIAIHICQLCRKNIASGLDAKGFPASCEPCRQKPRRSGSARKRKASAGKRRRP